MSVVPSDLRIGRTSGSQHTARRVVIVAVVTALAATACVGAAMVHRSEAWQIVEVAVAPGDTLWSIAKSVSGEEVDVREVVYEIKRLNELSGAFLQPGQLLRIPIVN